MIYDEINTKKITLGKEKQFNDENKYITPVYYDGLTFDYALKNKYINIDKIETNTFNKQFITIKSKEYSDAITKIVDTLGAFNPLMTDGSFRATINSKTKISEDVEDNSFNACISLSFPSIFKDKNTDKTTLQIHVRDIIVTKIFKDELEVDFDKLEKAM